MYYGSVEWTSRNAFLFVHSEKHIPNFKGQICVKSQDAIFRHAQSSVTKMRYEMNSAPAASTGVSNMWTVMSELYQIQE